jgi:hypothetical protein
MVGDWEKRVWKCSKLRVYPEKKTLEKASV